MFDGQGTQRSLWFFSIFIRLTLIRVGCSAHLSERKKARVSPGKTSHRDVSTVGSTVRTSGNPREGYPCSKILAQGRLFLTER